MAFASYVFDGIDDVIQHVWSSTATDAERRVWTASMWVKIDLSNEDSLLWQALTADASEWTLGWVDDDNIFLAQSGGMGVIVFDQPDNNVWMHYVFRVDTTLANAADRFRIYRNGSLLSPDNIAAVPQNTLTMMFQSGGLIEFGGFSDTDEFGAARLAFLDIVSGQSLGPDEFAFDNGGTWTRKPYGGSYGTFGLSLDGSQGFNDVSGNGFHFTNVGGVQLDFDDLPPHVAAEESFSSIYLGDTQINSIKLGSTDIKAVYLGSTKIFEASG